MKFGVFFVIFVSTCPVIFGVDKRWIPDLEWESDSNWVGGRIPVLDSHVEFPMEMLHALGLTGGDLRFSEIDLSWDGVLVFPENGKVEISDIRDESKKVSKWAKQGVFFWADPENWNTSSLAIPHLERVPCMSDTVIFPPKSHTLSIRMPMANVKVQSVRIADQKMPLSRWEWSSFRARREFSGTFSVRYADFVSCQGCPCQENDQDVYLEEICNIQRPRCGEKECEYPIQVDGHCCDFCGGRMRLGKKIFLPKIKRLTEQVMTSYANSLDWYVRKANDEETEILVVEKTSYTGISSEEVIEDLKKKFQEEGVSVISTELTGAPFRDRRLASGLVLFFAGLFTTIVLLYFTLFYYGYSSHEIFESIGEIWYSLEEAVQSKNKKERSFDFARFENLQEASVQLAPKTTEVEEEVSDDNDANSASKPSTFGGGRFENPLYRSKEVKKSIGHHNPLSVDNNIVLSALQDKADSERIEEIEMDMED